jgi:heptosyltransferase-1
VLLIKLSSLGDVVHTLPAAMDIRQACPEARIDWVVEPAFAPLVRLCPAVDRVIEMDLRRWRLSPWSSATRGAWRAFKQHLQAQTYDRVIDVQGLTKSALVSRLARLTPSGVRVAMAHRTEGSSFEAPTRWVADRCIELPTHIHAVDRARLLCAQALSFEVPTAFQAGLGELRLGAQPSPWVVCVHGTSREDKLWPEAHWVNLGQRLLQRQLMPVFVHGSEAEQARSQRLAAALPGSLVWPRMPIDALTRQMAQASGVIGVDSGLSHIAVALGLPHVQIYNFDTAWRTGPQHLPHQVAVYRPPTPSVEEVWQAWSGVLNLGQGLEQGA